MVKRRDREADPVPVGAVLSQLTRRKGWAEHLALGRLRDGWAEIVGANIAARSEPVKIEGGVLHVRTDGSAWATELTLLSGSIATKAAAFVGSEVVREVRVTAG